MMSNRVLMSAVEALEQVRRGGGGRGRGGAGPKGGGLLMMSDRVLISAVEALEQVRKGGGRQQHGKEEIKTQVQTEVGPRL